MSDAGAPQSPADGPSPPPLGADRGGAPAEPAAGGLTADAPTPPEPPAPTSTLVEASDAATPATTRGWRWPVLAAVAVAIALVAGAVGGWIAHRSFSTTTTTASAATEPMCPATTVADQVLPVVVTIQAIKGASGGTGSGEIIKNDGSTSYILTNNHVIAVAADGGKITVLLSSGQTLPATLVGRDPKVDLAVIKISPSQPPPTIALGDSATLTVGQAVVALGAPLGLSGSVTSGIVSALGRNVSVPGDTGQTALLAGAIQTDAAVNPGNSGGPLVDCIGALVGVNAAIATVPNEAGQAGGGSVGIGFAIPVNLASSVANQLIATGTTSHAYLGVSVLPIPPSVADRFGVSDGLYVASVTAGGPTAQAGIAKGDVITAIDGKPITTVDALVAVTLTHKPGDTVKVTYDRDGTSTTTTVTLGTQP